MRLLHLIACVATLSLGVTVGAIPTNNPGNYLATCKAIQDAISSASGVFYPGSTTYAEDIAHWIPTSTLNSTCSVEPGSVADVQAIIKILGKTTTPFAIKSGGHTFNQHFSSTLGIQIALTRLNEVTYDKKSNTVTLGMGGIWTDVYTILEKINITVSGGRIKGVGVGGYLLGGGYSYLSSQSGLSMDNVISFQVVLPNGTVATASSSTHSDLFWGLKGGFNNFGIVTSAVVKAFPMGQVYGGQLIYSGASLALLPAALASYAEMQNSANAVTKAGVITAYSVAPGSDPTAIVQIFYDGVTPPDRLLAPFKAIPADSSSLAVYSFTDFIAVVSVIFENPNNLRAASTTASVNKITAPVISQFWNITENLVSSFPHANSAVVMFEPFVPNAIIRPLTDGVFPHDVFASPLNAALWWTDPKQDAAGLKALDGAADQYETVLRKAGQPVDQMVLYPNYADADHPVSELYGPNLARAKALRAKIDPDGVMLRTGGWKFV